MSHHTAFLAQKTVGDVLDEKPNQAPLVDIHVSTTVEKVFETLLTHDFLSVPVYRIFNNVKDYVAIIDAYDLLSSIEERGITEESVTSPNEEFLAMPVAILVGMTINSSKLWTCTPSTPLTQLIELFTKQRVHRVLVLEEIPVNTDEVDDEDIVPRQQPNGRLLSQTDVVRYLLANNHELGAILDINADQIAGHALKYQEEIDPDSIDQLKRNPITITIQDQALKALQLMASSHASSIAVVDSTGALVAEMSAADLRGINPDRFKDLTKPVMVFLKSSKDSLRRPLSCRPRFSLGQIMSGVVRTHSHRSWLVDDEDRPVGCISLSDILSVFLD
ncbi:hypothetical protein BGZ73_007036 [Actinomortierella ambigua]|nr:hypothetical protein BGZ73_007036 [Actinomortierella ambigua]